MTCTSSRHPEYRLQGFIALVIDHAVEDQREQPGRHRAAQVAGERRLGLINEDVGLWRPSPGAWMDITRWAATWRVWMGNIGWSSSLKMK